MIVVTPKVFFNTPRVIFNTPRVFVVTPKVSEIRVRLTLSPYLFCEFYLEKFGRRGKKG